MKLLKPTILCDMDRCYLIIEKEQEEPLGYQQKMVLHNKLPGILEVEQRQVDACIKYYYDVTGKISLQEYFNKNKVAEAELEFIIMGIVRILQDSSQYLLLQDNFIISPEYIYIDAQDRIIFLCFMEGYQVKVREQMVRMAEYFMEKVDYKNENAIRLTYGLYKELREDGCRFQDIEGVIKHYHDAKIDDKEKIENVMAESVVYNEPMEIKKETSNKSFGKRGVLFGINMILISIFLKKRFIFYEYSQTINISRVLIGCLIMFICNLFLVLGFQKLRVKTKEGFSLEELEGEATIVLPYGEQYVLKGQGGFENIYIASFPCILGSARDQADKCIYAPGISKRHALLENSDGSIQIKDLKSTNGTFVNGEMLNASEPSILKEGDKITLANITYQLIKLS